MAKSALDFLELVQSIPNANFEHNLAISIRQVSQNLEDINTCTKILKLTHKLVPSLIQLMKYKGNNNSKGNNNQQGLQIRALSRGCLDLFRFYGNAEVIKQLINLGYIHAQYETISIDNNQNDKELWLSLSNIHFLFIDLRKGRRQKSFQTQLFPQPLLVKWSEECIEEIGGIEEIEAMLINQGYMKKIKENAFNIKKLISNNFQIF